MMWLLFLGLTILTWSAYDILFKVLGDGMNYFLALFFIGLFQVIVALPFVIYSYSAGELNYTAKGFYLSALMGILLAAGTIFFFYTFKYGAPFSVALPAYGVGALLIGSLAGILLFKEVITPTVFVGMIFGIASIILLTVK